MKLFSKSILAGLLVFLSFASNAQGINFQGVARSANGTIIASSNISLRLSIISKNVDATPEYVETKTVVTNAQGIFTVVVGDATNATVVGSFKTINWTEFPKFLKVEMDPSAGTNYINMGATQLQYVPYSFYSFGVAAENVSGVLPVTKGGTGVSTLANLKTALNISNIDTTLLSSRIDLKQDKIVPGNKGNIIQSDGSKWVSTSLNENVFSSFKVDTSNYRFQPSSLSKLKKGSDPFLPESAMGNIALGDSALFSTDSGYNNIAIGNKVLQNNKYGGNNIGIGAYALKDNTSGAGNIGIGIHTLFKNTSGILNTALGGASLNNNTTGDFNTAIGGATLASNTTGGYNTATGWGALMDNTTSVYNTANGFGALSKNSTGSNNTASGSNALYKNTNGTFNTASGYQALYNNLTGRFNTGLGSNSDVATGNLNNATAIGYGAIVSTSNTIQLGNTSVSDVKTSGIITAAGFKIPNGTSAQYLRADGTVTTSVTAGVPYSGASQAVDLGPYDMKVNSLTVGIGSGNASATINTAVGFDVLNSNTTGSQNTAVGYKALSSNTTGFGNTALGLESLLSNTTGYNNTSVGKMVLKYNTSGINNIGIGWAALQANTTGNSNIGIGGLSLVQNTTGDNNVSLGHQSLNLNTVGDGNTSIGFQSLYQNSVGSNNVAIGYESLKANRANNGIVAIGFQSMSNADNNNTGSLTGNTAVGYESLKGSLTFANNTGTKNSVLGYQALYSNSSGSNNIAFGYQALRFNLTGSENNAIGVGALNSNTSGQENIAIGTYALNANTTANSNIAIGKDAMYSNTIGVRNTSVGVASMRFNVDASWNTSIGYAALYLNQNGSGNTALGYESNYSNVSGNQNVAIGSMALRANTTGSNNTAIGKDAMSASLTYSNSSAIGFNAQVNASNQIQLGNSDVVEVRTSGVVSSAKGFLPPRLSSIERDAIVSPQTGLIVFCNNCGSKGQMQYYDGSAWVDMVGNTAVSGLNIGSSYQGGKIAYILQVGDPGYDPNRLHGIISSTVDQTIASYSGYFAGTGVMWQQGTYSVNTTIFDVTNAIGTALGTGKNNTDLIIAKQTLTGRPFAAAAIAVSYNGGGYSDWFLPSKDELSKLYINRSLIGGFEANWYWSSSEKNDAYAEAMNFATGNFDGIGGYKGPAGTPYKVRAVRYF